jgi:peptidoglycan hydrolase-like protein with peptidoglycan-binding domain
MLSAEQRTKIRQTVLASTDVPRVDNVNFSISVGTTVPSGVRVVEVPESLIEIYPEWRGDLYFVVRADIIIVDHDHRIVAVVPTGSSSAQFSPGSQVSTTGAGSLSLSREEIRQLQVALNEKGFNAGEPDGVLGSRTRQALIEFQQRQGFQARGQIDHQTMAALGLSNVGGRQGNAGAGQQGSQGGDQPATTGQGMMQQPPANQGAGATQQGSAGQSSTTGQGQGIQQQPANQGARTGQGQTPQNRNPNSGSAR